MEIQHYAGNPATLGAAVVTNHASPSHAPAAPPRAAARRLHRTLTGRSMRFAARPAAVPALLVAIAAAGIGALVATPAAAQQPPGWVAAKTPGYDLYAPNQALLDASRAQLDSARAAFARYFPGPAPKLHVVVADGRDELMRFDLKGLRAQVGEVLAWTVATPRTTPGGAIMEMKGDGEARSAMALFGNLSVAVSPAPHGAGALVRFVPSAGAGPGVDLRVGDVVRGVNGRTGVAMKELVAAYEALPAGAPVRLDVERDGKVETLSFAKPAGAPRGQIRHEPPPGAGASGGPTGGATGGSGEPRILSHEAGHQLFARWVQARLGGADAAREAMRTRLGEPASGELRVAYGSPLLPDWLDEAGATLSESEVTQAGRRRYILENFGSVIPLATLFAAEHPALPGLRAMAAARREAGTTGQQAGPVPVRVRRSADAMDPAMFYAQSLSVAEFMAEREGPTFLADVVDAMLRGQSMADVLRSASKLPKTVGALEREWSAWATR